jgi:hypothetical protein
MKKDKVKGRWTNKIIKTLPYRDEETGEIIPDNPPMNTEGFWKKPRVSTADYVQKNKHRKKTDH